LVRRLKILAQLVPYQTDTPQDGHVSLAGPEGEVDVRISVLPTNHGERVVLRFATRDAGLPRLPALGMPAELHERFAGLLQQPQGLILLTGPTGSGKTTTLYACLEHIHRSRGETTSIATIEDPIERSLPFLNQTEVRPRLGLTFAEGLRAALRQDPNVVMIGEVRDSETAEIAVRSGLTGHLILTTLHADSAAGVFARLIDAGVEPFLVASAVLASASQRLARALCPDCRQPAPPDELTLARLDSHGISVEGLTFHRADGCASCDGAGHRGRTAIFELLTVTPPLRELIVDKPPSHRIEEAAVRQGMTRLRHQAVLAAAAGRISLEEALRVSG
jgi:general secretion pathway protein E